METSKFAVELRKIEEKIMLWKNRMPCFKSEKQSVVRRSSSKKVFLKISQISKERSCIKVPF